MYARNASRLSAVVLLGTLALTAGCTSTDDSPGTPETGDSPAASSSSTAPEPSAEPSASSLPPTADASTAISLVERLLPTGEVPGLNAQWQWQDGLTAMVASPTPFGFCAKADLASIGATDVVERSYYPPDDSDDNAAEQIAEFPDTATAARAWAVLKSWHDTCARKRKNHPGLKVSALTSVPVTTGNALWYLLSWMPGDDDTGRFEAFGMVLSGTRIVQLTMDNSGQDYNYPAGQEPMVGMLRAATGLLT